MAKPRDNRQKDLLRPALEDIIDLGVAPSFPNCAGSGSRQLGGTSKAGVARSGIFLAFYSIAML
jgi:hypothetical protein